MEFTNDTSKVLASIYKIYLERRKEGKSHDEAARISKDFYKDVKSLSNFHESDIQSCFKELKDAEFVKMEVSGSAVILKPLVLHMEKRFKNGLLEVTEFISKFIP